MLEVVEFVRVLNCGLAGNKNRVVSGSFLSEVESRNETMTDGSGVRFDFHVVYKLNASHRIET